ncbi:MAG TPA: type 4b pilus protein PilO2 [Albitalea sp.]
MSTHVIEIGKRKFVCGLFWQSLSRPRELRKEAVELAGRINFDLMLLHRDQGVAQAGYAHSEDGALAGMYSLAAAVAAGIARRGAQFDGSRQVPHSWLGAFELPGGKWAYFAMREDAFLPNGDLCASREEVLERLLGDYGLGGWNVVIGEASLEEHGFHNYDAVRLQELLPLTRGRVNVHRQWMLSSVGRKVPWRRLTIGGLTVALLFMAAGFWWWRQREDDRARAIERVRAQLAAKRAEAAVVPHPWPERALPAAFTRACLEHMEFVTAGGWQLEEFACSPGQSAYTWTRGASTVSHLRSVMPDAVVELDGEKASFRREMALGSSTDERLLSSREVLLPLMGKLQGMGLVPTVAAAPPPPPPPQAAASGPPPRPEWQTFSFKVKTAGVPPAEVAQAVSLPGVRLNKLAYRGEEWIMEGVIYAK